MRIGSEIRPTPTPFTHLAVPSSEQDTGRGERIDKNPCVESKQKRKRTTN